jgi:glycosyltransferase involved in cell wall biosynthesis
VARILFLSELLPFPLVSGAKIRAYYVLRYLAAHHEVTLLSFVRADDCPGDMARLRDFLHEVHTVPMQRSWLRNIGAVLSSLVTGQPAIIAREQVGAMRRKVEELLGSTRFDVVHADQIPMAQFALLGEGTGVKRLLDQHNATFQIVERLAAHEAQGWKRAFLRREARAFLRYEMDACRRFDHVTFVTEEDRQALQTRGGIEEATTLPADRTTVIPICIDVEAVRPVAPGPMPFRVTHVGTMNWPPNVEGLLWFWEEVWPQVRAQVPGARLTVIGKNAPDRIRAMDRLDEVDVPGYVDDLAPYLADTAVSIVPLRAAGGMRVKILDAWSWGLPVVSTTIGAEGIALREGENILLADSPGEFAQAVVRLLSDERLRAQMRAGGRQWVKARYDWRRVYTAWDQVYERLLATQTPLPPPFAQ